MRALTFTGPKALEWHEVPEPTLQGDGEALVRPVAATTCDLDRAIVAGRTPLPPPFAIGHECVAEVVSHGEGVTRHAVGDLVVVPWHLSCGACERCRAGLVASCREVPTNAMYGTPIGGHHGGFFSDLVRVPYADAMLVPVPSGVDPATVASASDNLTDAWLAVSRPLATRPGSPVLIVGGAGSLALYAIELAKVAGAAAVDYVDRDPERLVLAEALGAKPIHQDEAGGLADYPVVVDASGRPEELKRALRAVGPGGMCTSVGVYFLDTPLPLLDMYAKDVTFRIGRPSVGPHIAEVLSFVEKGAIAPERITSEVAPFDDAREVLLRRPMKPVLVRERAHG